MSVESEVLCVLLAFVIFCLIGYDILKAIRTIINLQTETMVRTVNTATVHRPRVDIAEDGIELREVGVPGRDEPPPPYYSVVGL